MDHSLDLKLDRAAKIPLTEQIRHGISAAIESGVLAPGSRLPSWRDLASQLGVARGTVKAAYERLSDAQLVVSSRSCGTRVAKHPIRMVVASSAAEPEPMPDIYRDYASGPAIFQMGLPSPDSFPVKIFSKIRARTARAEVAAPAIYPDPRGDPDFRREVAAHLALSRGIECQVSQVFVATGYAGALSFVLKVLQLGGRSAWVEDPCFPLSRKALQLSGVLTVPVPVDDDGVDVGYGVRHAPDAALALVTPGQQAPLGPTLSLARRLQLLDWATQNNAWIVEDDYLGELQLKGRAAPALASLDRVGRVIHIGSFSKTISPTLRLGFIIVPPALVPQFTEAALCLAPAPDPAVQRATAEFMQEGHYLRHLRRVKRVYAARRDTLNTLLQSRGYSLRSAGLAMLLKLPDGARDAIITREAFAFGMAPAPLSIWYDSPASQKSGLLLGIATARGERLALSCDRLHELITKFA